METTGVLVIGAGAAGITAAHTIGGLLDTIVPEARSDRIGGRVYSSRVWPDETGDLGASRLTHALINPITDVIEEHGIETRASELLNFSLRTLDGKRLTDEKVWELFLLYTDIYVLRFPEVFWDADKDLVNLVDPDGDGAWSTWINFHKYTGNPVLACFNRTEHAERLESLSDDEVIDEAMAVIARAYGPRPQMQRSRWKADPFARGTLVYGPPGASSEDFVTLSLPVGRVGFAGDSTVAEYHGTVMAADLSGVREGSRVLYNAARRSAK